MNYPIFKIYILKPILKIHKEQQKEGCPKRKKKKKEKKMEYANMVPILIHFIFENSIPM